MSKQVLKRRIKATEQVAKVTKAMSNVAGRKLQKTQPMLKSAHEYLSALSTLMKDSASAEIAHPFLSNKPPSRSLAIIIATDKGLVGGLNRELSSFTKKQPGFTKSIVVGAKGLSANPSDAQIVHLLRNVGDLPTAEQVSPILSLVKKMYEIRDIDGLSLFFHEYRSASSHAPTRMDVLPLSPQFFAAQTGAHFSHDVPPQVLFDKLSHQYVLACIYHALINGKAVEHATRVSAMQAASQNATSMRQELLSRSFKQNQRAITSEIADTVNARRAISL